MFICLCEILEKTISDFTHIPKVASFVSLAYILSDNFLCIYILLKYVILQGF